MSLGLFDHQSPEQQLHALKQARSHDEEAWLAPSLQGPTMLAWAWMLEPMMTQQQPMLLNLTRKHSDAIVNEIVQASPSRTTLDSLLDSKFVEASHVENILKKWIRDPDPPTARQYYKRWLTKWFAHESTRPEFPSEIFKINALGSSVFHLLMQMPNAGDLVDIALNTFAPYQDTQNAMVQWRKESNQNTWLHEAVLSGSSDVVRALAVRFPDLLSQTNNEHQTAKDLAVAMDKHGMVRSFERVYPNPRGTKPLVKKAYSSVAPDAQGDLFG
jgi:hypothetical protein